jgi:hypothetical protein
LKNPRSLPRRGQIGPGQQKCRLPRSVCRCKFASKALGKNRLAVAARERRRGLSPKDNTVNDAPGAGGLFRAKAKSVQNRSATALQAAQTAPSKRPLSADCGSAHLWLMRINLPHHCFRGRSPRRHFRIRTARARGPAFFWQVGPRAVLTAAVGEAVRRAQLNSADPSR